MLLRDSLQLPPGLLIAAPRSGSGKTLVTLGLLRALNRQGVAVQPFKCGPDYIDGAFHEAAAGRASYNLDNWSMSDDTLTRISAQAEGSDMILAEGLMGLFDGVADKGASGHGSSAETAARFGWPVILVADLSGQSQTAGASLRGFIGFHPDVKIGGIILNKSGSPRHERLARLTVETLGVPILGVLPRQQHLALPERHLGLVQAEETADLERRLEAMADFVSDHIDLALLRSIAVSRPAEAAVQGRIRPPGQRIALARDAAFSFIYPHMLAAWRDAGAEILPFSPLMDEAPDDSADALWLPGGYPELHAGRLAANPAFLGTVRRFAQTRPVHGECGGYMVLGETLTDADGTAHPMLGLLSLQTSYARRQMHLGYRLATTREPSVLGPAGTALRGHEFHYASIIDPGSDQPLCSIEDASGQTVSETGSRRGRVSGTFFHMIDLVN
jgi:cobyrinic acid a,c-diamide synthase